jgi:hypothetical protein
MLDGLPTGVSNVSHVDVEAGTCAVQCWRATGHSDRRPVVPRRCLHVRWYMVTVRCRCVCGTCVGLALDMDLARAVAPAASACAVTASLGLHAARASQASSVRERCVCFFLGRWRSVATAFSTEARTRWTVAAHAAPVLPAPSTTQ